MQKLHEGTHDLNPITKLWQNLTSCQILIFKILEYIKVVEIVIAKMIRSEKNKRFFYHYL
jgi:hypothetical protein